jgi:hypothetical protein
LILLEYILCPLILKMLYPKSPTRSLFTESLMINHNQSILANYILNISLSYVKNSLSYFCLILAHPDLSAYRVVLSWHRINDHIESKEIA